MMPFRFDLFKISVFPINYASPFNEFGSMVGTWGFEPQTSTASRLIITALRFTGGLAAVRMESGKWGYIDKAGKFVIPPQFERAEPFSDGMARVGLDSEQSGYIEHHGIRSQTEIRQLRDPGEGRQKRARRQYDSKRVVFLPRSQCARLKDGTPGQFKVQWKPSSPGPLRRAGQG
jgi:hypothetical protein